MACCNVSFDVDFLHPTVAPGVGTTVPGGATYREAHLIMELLHDLDLARSVDIVELNPFLDERGRTARVAVELVSSLFGLQITDRRTPSNAVCRATPGAETNAVEAGRIQRDVFRQRAPQGFTRGCRIKPIGEILRFVGYLSFAKLHDAHRVRRYAVIAKHGFGDPEIAAADNPPDRKTLLVWLEESALLNVVRPRIRSPDCG